jgi:DNA polymerase elongation subunit (family B)
MTDKENTKQKIKAIYPHIVVGGDIDKPCYNIHWYDIEQKTMICGFGSYKLELVRKWLEEEFEVVERDIDGLLDSQQEEIEKLNVELVGMRGACNSYKMHYDNAIVENEELRAINESLKRDRPFIKAEAIKELEAKIHEKLHEAEMHGNFEPVVTREMFDSVVKEMGGEQE